MCTKQPIGIKYMLTIRESEYETRQSMKDAWRWQTHKNILQLMTIIPIALYDYRTKLWNTNWMWIMWSPIWDVVAAVQFLQSTLHVDQRMLYEISFWIPSSYICISKMLTRFWGIMPLAYTLSIGLSDICKIKCIAIIFYISLSFTWASLVICSCSCIRFQHINVINHAVMTKCDEYKKNFQGKM